MNPSPVKSQYNARIVESRNLGSRLGADDIERMKRPELVEKVFGLLKKHARLNLPPTYSAVNRLPIDELRSFYQFLTNPNPPAKKGKKPRPVCLLHDTNYSPNKSTYLYRQEMCDYLAQWGIRFENPSVLTPSLLEATANCLIGVYTPLNNASFAYKGKGILVIGPPRCGKTTLVRKFVEEEPKRAKLIADDDRSFVFAYGKPRVFHEAQLNSLEKRKPGFPLDMIIHLSLDRDTYQVEDTPYEQAVNDPEFAIPNGRIAESMQRIRFVKSGIVKPKVKIEFDYLPEGAKIAWANIAPIPVLPKPEDLQDFYTHMKKVILDRVT